jgi:hypothetical protein
MPVISSRVAAPAILCCKRPKSAVFNTLNTKVALPKKKAEEEKPTKQIAVH